MRKLFVACVIVGALTLPAAAQTKQPAPKPESPDSGEFALQPGGPIIELESEGGYLGVFLEEVTQPRMKELGLTQERGAIVMKVVPGGPAEKAGLKENDVIVSYNGQEVESVRQLQRLLRETPPGRSVSIQAISSGKPADLRVTLTKRDFSDINRGMAQSYDNWKNFPSVPPADLNFNFDADGFFPRPKLGVSAEPLTDQLAGFFGVKEGRGILVSEVTEHSAAADAGLKAGDIIIEFDNQRINSVDDLRKQLASKSEGPVTLKIVRDKKEQTVKVDLKKSPSFHQIKFLRVPHFFDFANQAV